MFRYNSRFVMSLVISALLLVGIAALRTGEYDEYYTVFLLAGHARPDWPVGIFSAGAVRAAYLGHAGLMQIAQDLRHGDVHPPLYFWVASFWRTWTGNGLFPLRLLSVGISVAGLWGLGKLAQATRVPVASAILMTVFCYGFAYTAIVARGFALAQSLNIFGVWLIYEALVRRSGSRALFGGFCLGAASFSNYLACFVGFGALFWLFLNGFKQWRLWVLALLGFGFFMPADGWFFIAQRSSRAGQFPPFQWPKALALLARDGGASVFGGLTTYGPWFVHMPVEVGLLGMTIGLLILMARQPQGLFVLCAFATPIGLLVLGRVFDNLPIEIRYLTFVLPFFGLLAAGALADMKPLRNAIIAVQIASVIGLAVAPATMQKQQILARDLAPLADPSTLILLPFGNDGVGLPGPFIAASPNRQTILLVKQNFEPAQLAAMIAPYRLVAVPLILGDGSSRAAVPAMLGLFKSASCWQAVPTQEGIAAFQNHCRGTTLNVISGIH